MAGKQNPKKSNHYVPQFLLRNFLEVGETMLHAYTSTSPHAGVFSAKPSTVFVKKNLYTELSSTGTHNYSLEGAFEELDRGAASLLSRILASVRSRKIPVLDDGSRQILDAFIYHQWTRTPDFQNPLLADLEAAVRKLHAKFQIERPDSNPPLDEVLKPSNLDLIAHNARRFAMSKRSEDVMQKMRRVRCNFMYITNPRSSFIVGSNPIVELPAISGKGAEIWFPVAADTAIAYFGPDGRSQGGELSQSQEIRKVNRAIARQSTMIASRSKALTLSLVGEVGSMRIVNPESRIS